MEKGRIKTRILYYFSSMVLFFAFVLAGLVIYYLFFPVNVLEMKNPNNLPLLKTELQAGEFIEYEADYCKFKDYTAIVYQSLVNHIVINFTAQERNFPVGCKKIIIKDIQIPEIMPEGEYRLWLNIDYKVNTLRTVHYHYQTEPFRIIK